MKIGDKVICIKRYDPRKLAYREVCPKYKQELTIRAIHRGKGLLFEEITNKHNRYAGGYYGECSFHIVNFRKIEPHAFTNSTTEELANKPLTKEKVEKIKEKELN